MEVIMAFDGVVVANLVHELSSLLTGGRILKISQPEKDEIVLTIKNYNQYKLFLSAGAGLPLVYLTETSKPNPMTAPNFCMLLRKYLSSARILSISQPGLERIIQIKIEHLDELGDICTKYLMVEIMGKHSNIIFCDSNYKIVDSIKHISGFVSSVREVLPGRDYFIPQTSEKFDPLSITHEQFLTGISSKPAPLSKAIYMTLTGFSPLLANELCHRATLDGELPAASFSEDMMLHLYKTFLRLIEEIKAHEFMPNILYQNEEPLEFSSLSLSCYTDSSITMVPFESISKLLETYFSTKNKVTRIRQKSSDLRRIVSNAIERSSKKYNLQLNQLKDTEKKDKYKVYGELLTTYGYEAKEGDKSLTVLNYYTNDELTIPLDPQLTAIENAKQYFERYSKLKRTYEALSKYILETKEELEHLESIRTSLDIALLEEDLVELKEELVQYGYMKRHTSAAKGGKPGKKNTKKIKITSKPFHYISSDGFHMYVGKNNFQNDELTFQFASGNDWWFHAKGIPGSHVLVKSEGRTLPDRAFEEAANLAAYYSKGKDSDKVEIDYLEKKNVKKPNGSKPGFVVYYTNFSMIASPILDGLCLTTET